jgi:hypothetical protein
MSETDKSREKSLYHLLLTVMRQLNAPPSSQKKQISEMLKTLEVVKDDGKFKISIIENQNRKVVEILVSDVKFYDTKNDPNIAGNNLKVARGIAIEFFPTLVAEKKFKKKIHRIENLDYVFIIFCLSMIFFSFDVVAGYASGTLAAISLCFIPFWNLCSNFNVITRWLVSISFSVLYLIFIDSRSTPVNLIQILLGINIASYFLYYSSNGGQKKWTFPLLAFSIGSIIINGFYPIPLYVVMFLTLEKILVIVFKISKLYGMYLYIILITGLILFLSHEIISTNTLNIFKFSQFFVFLLLSYFCLVGVGQNGAIRLANPAFATLCLTSAKSILFLVMGIFLFFAFQIFSRLLDRYNYEKWH